MKPIPFFSLTILGTAAWNTILVSVGALTGDAWESSLKYIGWYSKAAITLLVTVAVLMAYIIYKNKRLRSDKAIKEDNE
jgi:membrane protein DedA with SNARE-associated domain